MRVEVLGSEPMDWPGYGVTLVPGINEVADVPHGLKRSFERHAAVGALRVLPDVAPGPSGKPAGKTTKKPA